MDLEVPYFQTTSQAYPGFTALRKLEVLALEAWSWASCGEPWLDLRHGFDLPDPDAVPRLVWRKMQYPTAQLQLEVKKGTVLSQLLPPSPCGFN